MNRLGVDRLAERLRNEEYVGDQRCIPCTVFNLAIAVLGGMALGVATVAGGYPVAAGLGVGTVTVLVAVVAIGLRGYLVPYTPTITKRYFPDRVLRWFDKAGRKADTDETVDLVSVDEALKELGLVTDCVDGADLCLAPSFQRSWWERVEELQDRSDPSGAVAQLLDVDDSDRVRMNWYGTAAVAHVDNHRAGQWESEAAFVADLAADELLRDRRDEWPEMHPVNRIRVLNALRMFVERCPSCGEPVSLGRETTESCCRTMDVVAVTCEDCGARIFEVEVTEDLESQL